MSKKSDSYYFETFSDCASYAVKAAGLLQDILMNYDPEQLSTQLEKMHKIEHKADQKKHSMVDCLTKAFITPIEREDILSLSQNIDNITDTIEDAALRLYMCNIQTIRPEANRFSQLVIRCCETLKSVMDEFVRFKKSKTLKLLIIEINRLEEEGDALFLESMRKLHTTETDLVEIIAWRDIFNYLERCLDTCEHTSDLVLAIIMKNS
ncbi:MAG: DUF47 family protein [Lachnospiraceae bacterium]|nr:DUF47 family protein [Lachnospiraceae bacterium]